ncbi:gluconokinase [Streptomyces sp. TRM 70351]|uniref:gluconokinase n=1 Tax=Streptomyces sp. TRM 70351 TaxID=3116552 RepID=UPI002E7C13FA|nr:gluconokinase [Streptomyces sp. TRM 70351]MEE1928927.1 gluconokinase [Streptomyces sp. TRM 70351]
MSAPTVIVVMGVSGTGKSTVGALLAAELGVPYAEADAFHPPANIAKMSSGAPLTDADRAPWLAAIGAWARERGRDAAGCAGVVSCSALRRRYRDRLRAAEPGLFFLHLTGDRELISARLGRRRGHFMPGTLLDSQFAALEPLEADERGAAVSVTAAPPVLVGRALDALRRAEGPGGRPRGRAVSPR